MRGNSVIFTQSERKQQWPCHAPSPTVYGPSAAAKHLDKGWTLHYKPFQGITG
jgi:hypothetical protein